MTEAFIGATTEAPAIPPPRKPTVVYIEGGLLRAACVPCALSEFVSIADAGADDVGEKLKVFGRAHALCEVGR